MPSQLPRQPTPRSLFRPVSVPAPIQAALPTGGAPTVEPRGRIAAGAGGGPRHRRDGFGEAARQRSEGDLGLEPDCREHDGRRHHEDRTSAGVPVPGVRPGRRLRRRRRYRPRVRAVRVPRPRPAPQLHPGRGGSRRPPGAGHLLLLRADHPGCRLRRVAGADPGREGQDERHRLRHPRRGQPDRAPRPRRARRTDLLHPTGGTGCLATDTTGAPADVRSVAGLRDPAAGAQRHPVRATTAADAHLRPVHAGLHRGQGLRFEDLDGTQRTSRPPPRCSSPATRWSSSTPPCATRPRCEAWTSPSPPGCSPPPT